MNIESAAQVFLSFMVPILSFFMRGIYKQIQLHNTKVDENNHNLNELNTKVAVILERLDTNRNDMYTYQKRIRKTEDKLVELEKRFVTCNVKCSSKE